MHTKKINESDYARFNKIQVNYKKIVKPFEIVNEMVSNVYGHDLNTDNLLNFDDTLKSQKVKMTKNEYLRFLKVKEKYSNFSTTITKNSQKIDQEIEELYMKRLDKINEKNITELKKVHKATSSNKSISQKSNNGSIKGTNSRKSL